MLLYIKGKYVHIISKTVLLVAIALILRTAKILKRRRSYTLWLRSKLLTKLRLTVFTNHRLTIFTEQRLTVFTKVLCLVRLAVLHLLLILVEFVLMIVCCIFILYCWLLLNILCIFLVINYRWHHNRLAADTSTVLIITLVARNILHLLYIFFHKNRFICSVWLWKKLCSSHIVDVPITELIVWILLHIMNLIGILIERILFKFLKKKITVLVHIMTIFI